LKKLALFFTFSFGLVFSSFPFTHLRFCEFFLDAHGIKDYAKENLFIIGAFYPEILCIPAEKLSFNKRDKSIYTYEEAFHNALFIDDYLEKGMWYHIYIDRLREKIIEETRIKEKFPILKQKNGELILGFLEDEFVYNVRAANRGYLCYQGFNIREFLFYDDLERLISLRMFLLSYFKQRPRHFIKNHILSFEPIFNLPLEELRKVLVAVNKLLNNRQIFDYIQAFYNKVVDDLVDVMMQEKRDEIEKRWRERFNDSILSVELSKG